MGAWFWALISVAVLLVAVDRLMAWADARRERRGLARRRRARPPGAGTTTGGPGFGDIVEIFQPTARYLHEEQERQRHDLVQPGDADPDWEVDLDGRTARMPPPHGRPADPSVG